MINVKTNSRRIQEGDTFIALRGIRGDGHDYIEDAIARGAKKVIVEQGSYSVPYETVADTRSYLNQYLRTHYNEELNKIQIIGITGTNGKTTICRLLSQALNACGHKCASIGTLGFFIGDELIENLENSTPDLCELYEFITRSIDEKCEYVVMEVSSHSLMNGRVETLFFNHAIFTNLTQDHLDYHVTIENYVLAKQRLFKKIKSGGIAIVNIDDPTAENFLFPQNHNITYGYGKADFQILKDTLKEGATTFQFQYHQDVYEVQTKLTGRFNIYNMMPVIIFLLCIGEDPVRILKTVYTLKAIDGRYHMIPYQNNKIVIDYAHTPDAILKIIETARQFCKGKIYVVFGCTGERDRLKRPIMTKIVSENTEKFIITEDDLYYEDFEQIKNDMLLGLTIDNYEVIEDRKKAILKGISYLKEDDTLLILGKGHEEILKIREKRIPFNDAAVVMEYIQKN